MNLLAKRFTRHYLKNYLVIIMVMVCAITMIYMPGLFESSVKYGESEYMKEWTHDCDVMLTGDAEKIISILAEADDSEYFSYTRDSDNVYVTIHDKQRTKYIALEISYMIGQSGENIEINAFYDNQPVAPQLLLTLLIVRIVFTLFAVLAVVMAYRLFNENRRNDLNSLVRLGISCTDIRKLFLSEITVMMTASTIISTILCDAVMKIAISRFYSFSEVFAHIAYHKDMRTFADLISSVIIIIILSCILIMKNIRKERTEYTYHFRSLAESQKTSSLTEALTFRDWRYSLPIIIFSVLAVFVTVSAACVPCLLYNEDSNADIIITADRNTVYSNSAYTESIFSLIDETITGCEITDNMSYTGFTVQTDKFSKYETYEIINNKESVLVRIIPVDNGPDFMSAYVSSEYDLTLFNKDTINLKSISEDRINHSGIEIALSDVYPTDTAESVLTLYVSSETFEAVCGFSPVTISKALKFNSDDDYTTALDSLDSILTDGFEITDLRKNIREQNSNAKAIEFIIVFMSGMFTVGSSVIIFAYSATEKLSNEASDRIILRLGVLPGYLRAEHIKACGIRYIFALAIGMIPSGAVIVLSILKSTSLPPWESYVYPAVVLVLLFVSSSCAYFMKGKSSE